VLLAVFVEYIPIAITFIRAPAHVALLRCVFRFTNEINSKKIFEIDCKFWVKYRGEEEVVPCQGMQFSLRWADGNRIVEWGEHSMLDSRDLLGKTVM
jgi:hypothetical protein